MIKTGLKGNKTVYTFLGTEKETKNRVKWKENVVAYTFLGPALLLLLLFLIIPAIMSVYYAFTDYYLLTPDMRK
ncbi:MAG: sugar ABC transporter permease, partial [Priestia megaterium]